MRPLFLIFGGLVSGAITLVGTVTLLAIAASIYLRQTLHLGPNEAIGFDIVSLFVSLFGPHWQFVIPALLVGIFAVGFSWGYWFLGKRILR